MSGMGTAKKLAVTSIFTAFAVIFSVFGSVVPPAAGFLLIVGSAMMLAVAVECGTKYAVAGFAAAAVLMLILSADKSVPALYIAYTGWYPVAKVHAERLRKKWKRIILKCTLGFAASLSGCALGRMAGVPDMDWYLVPVLTAGSLLYDRSLDVLMYFYRRKIRKHIK